MKATSQRHAVQSLHRRKTSIYALTVPAHVEKNALLDAIIAAVDAEPDVLRAGAWTQNGNAIVLFRASNTPTAIAVAERAGGNTPGSKLLTGAGVYQHVVAHA